MLQVNQSAKGNEERVLKQRKMSSPKGTGMHSVFLLPRSDVQTHSDIEVPYSAHHATKYSSTCFLVHRKQGHLRPRPPSS